MILIECELTGHMGSHLRTVAGEHDRAVDAQATELGDGIGGIGLDLIADDDVAGVGKGDLPRPFL